MVAEKGDFQPSSSPAPATVIGHRFVRQYYSLLDKDPAKLYRLYKAQSVLSHRIEGEGGTLISAQGPSEIHSELLASLGPLERHGCEVEITGIECQESCKGGVLVLVTGCMTFAASGERRPFAQAIFLDKQTEPYDGYFVLNDMLRYLPSAEARPAAAAAPRQAQPEVPSPAPAYEPAMQSVNADQGFHEDPHIDEDAIASEPDEQPAEQDPHIDEDAVVTEPDEQPAEQADEQEAEEADVLQPEEDEQPKTWAAMAGKLRQGSGTLASAKPRAGFSLPAPKPTMPVLPPPTAAVKAEAAKAVAAAGGKIASLPPPSSAAAKPGNSVRIWLSKLPVEVAAKELLESINSLLDASAGRAIELDRKDSSKDWAYLVMSTQEAADAVVKLSKQRKLQHQGRPLKADLLDPQGNDSVADSRRDNRRGKGWKGGNEDGHTDGKSHGKGGKGGGKNAGKSGGGRNGTGEGGGSGDGKDGKRRPPGSSGGRGKGSPQQ